MLKKILILGCIFLMSCSSDKKYQAQGAELAQVKKDLELVRKDLAVKGEEINSCSLQLSDAKLRITKHEEAYAVLENSTKGLCHSYENVTCVNRSQVETVPVGSRVWYSLSCSTEPIKVKIERINLRNRLVFPTFEYNGQIYTPRPRDPSEGSSFDRSIFIGNIHIQILSCTSKECKLQCSELLRDEHLLDDGYLKTCGVQ